MRDIYEAIARRLCAGESFAVATLVATSGSAPSPIGTSILVDGDGSFLGNIGAGCHEAHIVEAARIALRGDGEAELHFGLRDELLDGSACGAVLTVAVWLPLPSFALTAELIAKGLERVTFSVGAHVLTIEPMRRLVVAGATSLAAELTRMARAADFHVTVVDPRPGFATRSRQPDAGALIVGWPQDALPSLLDDRTSLVVLSHDVKIDLPAIRCGLEANVPYVGALGSRRAQSARREELAHLGYGADALHRIRGPVGLDIGATTEGQIACAILAELLAVLNRRLALPLCDGLSRQPLEGPDTLARNACMPPSIRGNARGAGRDVDIHRRSSYTREHRPEG